jgi:hypothetical protein
MKIPGLSTTRLHLLLAALCALSHSTGGWITMTLLLGVTVARLAIQRHHDTLPHTAGASGSTDVPSIVSLAPEGRAA